MPSTPSCSHHRSHLLPPPRQVHFIVASCENMVDAAGLRPGDILVGAKGKTVEVNNTDAEGRLTLADALAYAQGDACPGVEVRTHRQPRWAGGRAGWPRERHCC